jgi:hypothetical protein
MNAVLLYDRKKRPHVLGPCERPTEIGQLSDERRRMFLAVARDLDARTPGTLPTNTEDSDCMSCGWPADEHAELNAIDKKRSEQWIEDCMHWRGRVLTGEKAHWCRDWDGLPVDETCDEEFSCCHCFDQGTPSEAQP